MTWFAPPVSILRWFGVPMRSLCRMTTSVFSVQDRLQRMVAARQVVVFRVVPVKRLADG